MKKVLLPLGMLLATGLGASAANLIVNGDFEDTTGTFPNGWTTSGAIGQDTAAPELLAGATSARMASGANIAQDSLGGLSDFTMEFLFRPRFDTADRSMNLIVHGGGSTGTSTASPALNLRISGNADGGAGSTLQVFDGGWQSLGTPNTFTTGAVYRMQIAGSDWGTGGASYDVAWSDANMTALTNSVSDVSFFQTDNLVVDRVRFAGPSNSYNLDNVSLEAIPEPAAPILASLAALGLSLRRRRS